MKICERCNGDHHACDRGEGCAVKTQVMQETILMQGMVAGKDMMTAAAQIMEPHYVPDEEQHPEDFVHNFTVAAAPPSETEQCVVPAGKYELRDGHNDNDSRHRFGLVMKAMFPAGLECKTSGDFNRLGIFTKCINEMLLYAPNLTTGGHHGCAFNLSLYAAMLGEESDA